jgi:hypothetical protein
MVFANDVAVDVGTYGGVMLERVDDVICKGV